MKLRIRVESYRRTLATPLATGRGVLMEREGILVRLADAEGGVGSGEAAPVYWIDDDALAAVRDQLNALNGRAVEVEGLDSLDDVGAAVVALMGTEASRSLRPAARAAIETAALDLASRRRGVAVATLLGGSADVAIAVNALVATAEPAAVGQEVRRHLANGVRAIKLKVGTCAPGVDVERIRAAATAAANGGVRLRLDANRAWSPSVAESVLAAAPRDAIDYVEEPLAQPTLSGLARLRAATRVAVAIDESLSLLGGVAPLAAATACDVVVLKPARIGGPLPTLVLARDAREHGLRCVLTDSIETAVGRAAVVHTAAALGGDLEAIGLGGPGLVDDEPIHPCMRPCGPGLAVRGESCS